MSNHVSDLELARFRAGKLDRAGVEAVGAHVRECPQCAARVWGAREVRDSAAAVARNAAARPSPLRWLAAAAVLLFVAAIAALALRQPARHGAPPGPVVVRPAAHPWDALVAEALRSGEVERPAWVRPGAAEVVRGPADAVALRLLAPVGVAVESQTPELRWTPATPCEVTIAREGNAVARSGRIVAASWTPPAPLARGVSYDWQVTIAGPLHVTARFRVLSDEEARLLASVRASGDPAATGIVAARLGVIDEALAQLGRSRDPRAHAVAETIRRWQ
jgi:hypothetical protein